MIILFIVYLINIIIFNFSIYNCRMKKKVVPKLRQEVKVKVDIVTNDDIKMYYTGKFQDFSARYIINEFILFQIYFQGVEHAKYFRVFIPKIFLVYGALLFGYYQLRFHPNVSTGFPIPSVT